MVLFNLYILSSVWCKITVGRGSELKLTFKGPALDKIVQISLSLWRAFHVYPSQLDLCNLSVPLFY